MANTLVIAATAALFLFVVQNVFTDEGSGKRVLTPDEEALAEEARLEIAQVLERNLIKFFTLVAADNGRELFSRQTDEDDDDGGGLNPQVLPQVAQILGAIFGGGLNISKIVDQSFSLATDTIRNQVDGIFKLLTGQQITTTTTTSKPSTAKPQRRKKTTTTQNPSDYDEPTTRKPTRYQVRNKTKTTLRPFNVIDPFGGEEEELHKLEEEVISAAIDAEPYVRDKQPRFIFNSVRNILGGFDSGRFNITQVIRFLPDLFTGARQAFTLLENLGQLAGIELDDD